MTLTEIFREVFHAHSLHLSCWRLPGEVRSEFVAVVKLKKALSVSAQAFALIEDHIV